MPLPFLSQPHAASTKRRQFVRLAVISVIATITAVKAAPVSVAPVSAPGSQAQAADDNRVAASFVLARGRLPTAAEAQQWSASAASPFTELLARHRQALDADANERRSVALKADLDAFGAAPGSRGPASEAAAGTYTDLVRQHLAWLDAHPDEYANVVRRAYRLVLRREAYPPELEYWAKRPVLSFALLAACINDWARRNQPGLTVTSGPAAANINSPCLATVRLSPALAAEARAAAGFERPRNAALGRHVVAPGAGEVLSVGGIHFAAAGAADLVSVEADASTSTPTWRGVPDA